MPFGVMGVLSIRSGSLDYSEYSPVKAHVEMMFFEKIRTRHGISVEELVKMKNNNPEKLRALINDNKIADWMLNIREKKQDQKKINKGRNKKKIFLMELSSIIDKMDVWGE